MSAFDVALNKRGSKNDDPQTGVGTISDIPELAVLPGQTMLNLRLKGRSCNRDRLTAQERGRTGQWAVE